MALTEMLGYQSHIFYLQYGPPEFSKKCEEEMYYLFLLSLVLYMQCNTIYSVDLYIRNVKGDLRVSNFIFVWSQGNLAPY